MTDDDFRDALEQLRKHHAAPQNADVPVVLALSVTNSPSNIGSPIWLPTLHTVEFKPTMRPAFGSFTVTNEQLVELLIAGVAVVNAAYGRVPLDPKDR